jgi:hypothetical protein
MKIYLVINESPWGDDRTTDSVWLTKREAEKRIAVLNPVEYGYAWSLESLIVGKPGKVC